MLTERSTEFNDDSMPNAPKKKTYGVQPKTRTLDEINQEYNQNAIQVGHKGRIIQTLEKEIALHLHRMQVVTEEAQKLPKDAPVTAPEAQAVQE